jgi:hypothetical protein
VVAAENPNCRKFLQFNQLEFERLAACTMPATSPGAAAYTSFRLKHA